ncbi:hypothetical protein LPJ72_004945 [Coemansia sp. Benny D160-2]|nr:hypothetical protein LPJ72_004945 [Coemansia sp. Benny D160-2]
MIVGRTVVGLVAAGLSTAVASAVGGGAGAGAGAGAAGLFQRSANSTSDLDGFKGALLLKNGRQTSCEVALMDNSYGFVAANCLDYQPSTSNGTALGGQLQLNQTTAYTVMVSQGFVGAFATLGVSKVTPNAQYDPASFANNVALVEFSATSSADSFVNYIASWRPEWSSLYFVRRTLDTATNASWTQPATASTAADAASGGGCAAANALFALNTQDLLCSTAMVANVFNASCAIPFGSVYGVVGANTAVAALYSHSALAAAADDSQPQAEPFCRGAATYNYYIVLQHYVHWAMELMGRKAPVFHSHLAEYSEVLDPRYSMAVPSPRSVAGYAVYGGDLYNLQPPAAPEEGKRKLSAGAVAGIVLALLALLALLAGLFLWRRMRKLKSNRVRRWWFFGRFDTSDEKKEQQQQQQNSQAPPRELMDDLEYAPHARRSTDSWDGAADLMDQNTVIGSSDNTPPYPLKLKSGSDSEDERGPRRGKAGSPPSYAIEF